MSNLMKGCGLLAVAVALAAGCTESNRTAGAARAQGVADATYLLADRPENAAGVAEIRKSSRDDEEVTMVGRIGGTSQPFVDGLAAFTVVDPGLSTCSEEGCSCCKGDELLQCTAVIRIVDAQGRLVARDARELLDVGESSTVVVRGKTRRDEQGNLTVLAEKVHVVKEEE